MAWDSTTATRRLADMPPPEPLHPELEACLTRRTGRLASLEHPLIVQSPYIPALAGHVNGLFESLHERAAMLLDTGAYYQWIELHAAAFRLTVLSQNAHRVDHGGYWELLATLYRCEAPACDRPDGQWLEAITAQKPQRHRFMTRAEQQMFAGLPALVPVWRLIPEGRPDGAFAHFVAANAARDVARSALREPSPPVSGFSLVMGTLPKAAVLAAVKVHGRVELLARPGSAKDEQQLGPAP
jgi:hypothetical protein